MKASGPVQVGRVKSLWRAISQAFCNVNWVLSVEFSERCTA
ncbi:hypothetical protein FRUB_07053 [Fimbriiglobus ruber]|uniref:Uncharacterized protein n=1 Tax=Fimbriiglobus ruber TaxID=1908690 RepID=A0A225DAE3_9BACT|nr:hypothetical protein FRUB_07053 [Fimbriiglobus ruber]